MARAEPNRPTYNPLTHDPDDFLSSRPVATGKATAVNMTVFNIWAQTLPLYTTWDMEEIVEDEGRTELRFKNRLPEMVKLTDTAAYIVQKSYPQASRAELCPADFDAGGDIRV